MGKKHGKKAMGVRVDYASERSKSQHKQEGGVDVLCSMVVTAAVSHFEMSALN
tara:strand:- start:73 stop:231 length:159 start_codon:yes stop_codon:yes gene_type:complete